MIRSASANNSEIVIPSNSDGVGLAVANAATSIIASCKSTSKAGAGFVTVNTIKSIIASCKSEREEEAGEVGANIGSARLTTLSI